MIRLQRRCNRSRASIRRMIRNVSAGAI